VSLVLKCTFIEGEWCTEYIGEWQKEVTAQRFCDIANEKLDPSKEQYYTITGVPILWEKREGQSL
jgi:hypothetical protein